MKKTGREETRIMGLVKSLIYKLEAPEHVRYEEAKPLQRSFEGFDCRLEGGILTFTMQKQLSGEAEARRCVDEVLRSWEAYAAIQGHDQVQFVFRKSVVDWGQGDINPPQRDRVRATFRPAQEIRGNYPDPPPDEFSLNADADSIWYRYKRYLDGREPAPAMGYYCLTVVEALAGKRRKEAARTYAIDHDVLSKLGYLTSTRGDTKTTRKHPPEKPLTRDEKLWIRAVIKQLVFRVGHSQPSSLPKLTMSDLPDLPAPPTDV